MRLHTDLSPELAVREGERAAANVAAVRRLLGQTASNPTGRRGGAGWGGAVTAEGGPVDVAAWDRPEPWDDLTLPWQAGSARATPGGSALLPTRWSPFILRPDGPDRSVWYGPAIGGLPSRGAVAGLLATDFGVTESSWVRDGLMEVGRFRTIGGPRVRVTKDVYDYLRGTSAHPALRPRVREIADFGSGPPAINPDFAPYGLDPATAAPFRGAYTHMMLHNPNYRDRFRRLLPDLLRDAGRAEAAYRASRSPSQPVQQVLTRSVGSGPGGATLVRPAPPPTPESAALLAEAVTDTYENEFGPDAARLQFEFDHLLDNFEQGVDPSLIAWDWSAGASPLDVGRKRAVSVPVDARRGWQPTAVGVSAGQTILFRAKGCWIVGADRPIPHFAPGSVPGDEPPADDADEPARPDPVDADGCGDGRGRLVAAVFDPLRLTLSEPIELGRRGEFVAPADGQLALRCRDGWGQLSDNAGRLTVRLARPASD